ncbi:YXWGXW repeat-containing protein [Aerosticca soli]|jgi:hypothetical protein|uniref:YXWGXW repeat-containing protein n=1 Tax=Aerosticca soli TaxID=2010829 RepID=UPI000F825C0E|nr:YXWGXW repeat-containing protein [Aerosticca soli]MDI3261352.1 YXWGXW repeat-containing protein [Fulvimonas sp.]
MPSLSRRLAPAALLLALAGAAGHAPALHADTVVLDVRVAPPPPRYAPPPPPRRGYVWVPGYWRWEGHRHVWVEGYWVRERPGWHYVPDHWVRRGPYWHFVPGHWVR